MISPIIKNFLHFLSNRFIVLIAFLLIISALSIVNSGSILPSTETKDLWFYSGLFMVIFSILFIEPYYSSPKNVITNVIPLLLVFLAIKGSFNKAYYWWATIFALLLLLIVSIVALVLADDSKSPDYWKNRVSTVIKNVVVKIGQGKVLYSFVFFYFLLAYRSIQDFYTLFMFILWAFIILINPKYLHGQFGILKTKKSTEEVGEIFGVQSKKIFLVKLYEDKQSIKKFDLVIYRYSMQDTKGGNATGIVFDTYLLNQEKWAKVLQLDDPSRKDAKLEKNVIYKIDDVTDIESSNVRLRVDDLVGIVIEGSTINKIKFEYSKKKDDLQEGDLLELNVGERRLFYQVIGGSTNKERLEARNESGFIEGEAIQLGEWQKSSLSFQKFGWVPSINTPLFKANTADIEIEEIRYPQYTLGKIPGTTLPSIIDLHDAISHHIALLGVTGSGKSFIAREIIKEIGKDTKVICVDLTGEWLEHLAKLKPERLIDTAKLLATEELMAKKESAAKSKDNSGVLELKKIMQGRLQGYIKAFAESKNNLTIFELPDLSNTSFILEFTQMFLESVFIYAKQNKGNKFCIVLEEAHTIIPETSFLGDLGEYSSNKGLVSKMGQIALQGRKYGVGFIVIAQRTANVSKTVLTQCNTVMCFQAFDETSFTFLGNYVGKDMIQALPSLKPYHAVVAGKAISSNMPMIVDLTRSDCS